MASIFLLLSLIDRILIGEFDPYTFPLWAVLLFMPIVAWTEWQGLSIFVKFLSTLNQKPEPAWRLPLLSISFGLSQVTTLVSHFALYLGFDNGLMLGSVFQFLFILLLDKVLNPKKPDP